MEDILTFVNENLNYKLLLVIVLGGIYITKYSKRVTKIADVYKVLIASFLFSIIFYLISPCGRDCAHEYLFTYLFATSFYEVIVKEIINKINPNDTRTKK